MTSDIRLLEELLIDRIGLDPKSVGSQLILHAVKQRMKDLNLRRSGSLRTPSRAVGTRASRADRGSGGRGELVLPR